MASRKQKHDLDRVYKITYKSSGTEYADNVAAVGFEKALEIWRLTQNAGFVTKIERTDIHVYYGAIG